MLSTPYKKPRAIGKLEGRGGGKHWKKKEVIWGKEEEWTFFLANPVGWTTLNLRWIWRETSGGETQQGLKSWGKVEK
jgi:hypothetical protein